MTFLKNPYQFSDPVYQTGKFFGRQTVLTRLSRAVQSNRSVQLVGQFRIGKSSILRYLQEHFAEFVDNDRLISIHYDLSRRPRLRNGDDFFARILQLMSYSLIEHGQQKAALSPTLDLTDPSSFDEFVDYWAVEEGYQFVFLLDEFGLIAGDEDFERDFFDNLRATAATPELTFIVAAPHSLSNFAHKQAISSPLWNTLELVRVTLFEKRKYIQELICGPAEQSGLFWPTKAESFIYERGGQHPCYIQMAAYALFDTCIDGQLDYNRADKMFRDTAIDHFRFYWTNALVDRYRPEYESLLKNALLDLIHGRSIDDGLAEDIEARGLVWRNEYSNSWEPLSMWFADWLRRWSTDKRVTIERASSKSLQQTMNLQQGQILGGVYRVEEIINVTAHSQVARAHDELLGRKVKIKCPRLEHELDDTAQRLKENLSREANIMANLDHPNIGKVHQALLEPLGIVMEWIEGVSLEDIIDAGETLPAPSVIHIGIKLANALDYVHREGIVHRDIKPGNIILKKTNEPILIDFDVARSNTRETISRRADGSFGYVGTKKFSAPEQFLNPEGVGPPTDLFALGLVLYQILTGKSPFEYGNLPSLYENGQFPKPDQFDIPEPLYKIIISLLLQQPELRPSGGELRDYLQNCFLEANYS